MKLPKLENIDHIIYDPHDDQSMGAALIIMYVDPQKSFLDYTSSLIENWEKTERVLLLNMHSQLCSDHKGDIWYINNYETTVPNRGKVVRHPQKTCMQLTQQSVSLKILPPFLGPLLEREEPFMTFLYKEHRNLNHWKNLMSPNGLKFLKMSPESHDTKNCFPINIESHDTKNCFPINIESHDTKNCFPINIESHDTKNCIPINIEYGIIFIKCKPYLVRKCHLKQDRVCKNCVSIHCQNHLVELLKNSTDCYIPDFYIVSSTIEDLHETHYVYRVNSQYAKYESRLEQFFQKMGGRGNANDMVLRSTIIIDDDRNYTGVLIEPKTKKWGYYIGSDQIIWKKPTQNKTIPTHLKFLTIRLHPNRPVMESKVVREFMKRICRSYHLIELSNNVDKLLIINTKSEDYVNYDLLLLEEIDHIEPDKSDGN